MSELPKQSTPASELPLNTKEMQTQLREKHSGTYVYKIDRENIVEEYRSLRQKQQQFLAKINMKTQMKRALFGFPDSYYCQNTEAAENLVVENHPFMGKLVIDEKKWEEHEKQRAEERQKKKKQAHSYAELDIQIEKNSERMLSDDMLIEKPSSQNVQKLLNKLMEDDGKKSEISSIKPKRKKEIVGSINSGGEEMIKL